jgi:hypothetical protein
MLNSACGTRFFRLGWANAFLTGPVREQGMLSESEARSALRRMGYRLSQFNSGYMILDAGHNYVGIAEDGRHREMTLGEVAEWIEAESAPVPNAGAECEISDDAGAIAQPANPHLLES